MQRDEWDTDPYGDAAAPANPWMTGDTATAPATAPPAAAPATSDTSGGIPWTEQNPFDTQPPPQPKPQSSAPSDYDAHLSNISQASDPASQATAQDALARQLHTDLEADGHTVKWSSPTALSVDGRSYELGDGGGGQGITDPGFGPDTFAQDLTALYHKYNRPDPTPQEIQSHRGNPNGLAGVELMLMGQAGLDAVHNGAENPTPPVTPASPGAGGRLDDNAILAQIAKWAAMPGADPSLAADPTYWLNAIKGRGGLGSDNLQYWQNASVGPTAFFNNPNREGGSAGGASGGAAGGGSPWLSGGASTYPAWSPTAPTYAPGPGDFIDASASELPNFKDILDLLNTPAAGDAELQKLVQGIVEHPETLTDQDIAMLKARSAEEAAVAGQSQDEELQHFGFNTGLDSSPWLAGARAQNAWNRSNSTITANRGIDIAAADRRQSDRQSAAAIGQGYSSFQSSKKAQAVGLAVTAALGKAGEQRSRTQLNQSLKQAATQLGLTKDNLVMTYLNHAMDDLTRNKQIDLNFDVDMKKLAEQSEEFKQTLLQRIAELRQQDDQFKANYGLAAAEFQHKKDQDAWERAKSAVG